MNQETKPHPWLWRALHFATMLLTPVLISLLLSGCIKAKEEPADLGPEVAAEQIDLALSKAVRGVSLADTAVGQYVSYSVVRRLENGEITEMLGADAALIGEVTDGLRLPRWHVQQVTTWRPPKFS